METLDIIEQNLTKDEFISFLRGTIIKFALQGQDYGYAMNIKLHADKLVEVLEKQRADTMGTMDTGCSCLQTQAPEPTVDPDEPKVQPKHEFKLGDHVVVSKGTANERTGVIVRLPMDGVDCSRSYVVDLDDKNLGWIATVDVDGVDCKNAWVAYSQAMELLPTTLQKNTWYHTTDFTLEELKELLPKGTRLQVEKPVLYDGIETTPPTKTQTTTVESVTTSFLTEEPLIETTGGTFLKEWFKIVED